MSFISRFFPDRTPRPPLLLDRALVESTSDYADHDCVQAVVNYVNAAQNSALLHVDELPDAACEIYEVDRYLAQVNNGGHGQYWHNCGRHLSEMAPRVERGLRAIKAKRHLKIFRHYLKEMRGKTPDADFYVSINMSSHFSILDDEFFRVEKSEPLTSKQAARIRDLPDLALLDEQALKTAFTELAEANAQFAIRSTARDVARRGWWFTTPQAVAAGLALAKSDPPDLFGGLTGGGKIIDMAGQSGILFNAETLNGRAKIIYHETFCFAHESLSPEEIEAEQARRVAGNEPHKDDADFRDRVWALDGAGRRLATINDLDVTAVIEFAARTDLAVAIHALLEQAEITGEITHAGCLSEGQRASEMGELAALLRVDGHLLMVVADGEGACLMSHDTTRVLAEISAEDVATRAEALRKA